MSLQFVLAFTDLISKNVMKKSTHYLFDFSYINKPFNFKLTKMKKFNHSAFVFVMCIVFALNGSDSHAQSKFDKTNYKVDSRVASGSVLHVLRNPKESNILNLIPRAYGFGDKHEFSSR